MPGCRRGDGVGGARRGETAPQSNLTPDDRTMSVVDANDFADATAWPHRSWSRRGALPTGWHAVPAQGSSAYPSLAGAEPNHAAPHEATMCVASVRIGTLGLVWSIDGVKKGVDQSVSAEPLLRSVVALLRAHRTVLDELSRPAFSRELTILHLAIWATRATSTTSQAVQKSQRRE